MSTTSYHPHLCHIKGAFLLIISQQWIKMRLWATFYLHTYTCPYYEFIFNRTEKFRELNHVRVLNLSTYNWSQWFTCNLLHKFENLVHRHVLQNLVPITIELNNCGLRKRTIYIKIKGPTHFATPTTNMEIWVDDPIATPKDMSCKDN